VSIRACCEHVEVLSGEGERKAISVGFRGDVRELEPGGVIRFDLSD
jgi:hypothetical protein